MPDFRQSSRSIAITFATLAILAAGLFLSRPQPVESGLLGAEWSCSRTAFVLTSCSPASTQASPVVQTSRKLAVRAPGA
jgi:hypothetical protein